MADTPNHEAGFFSSLKKLADLSLATVQNRLELFALELQEEKCRLVDVILFTAAVIGLGAVAVTLLTITLVLAFWENGRLAALLSLSLIYLVGAGLAYRKLKGRLNRTRAFEDSVAELKMDRACLQTEK